MDQAGSALAARLNTLFDAVRGPDGKTYSNEQVAAAIRATDRVKSISQSYIWSLRNGASDNPTKRQLEGLAEFFGVPVSYFFDDDQAARIDEKLAELKAERTHLNQLNESSETQLLALRAGQLSPEGRRQVLDLLDVVYRLEAAERKNHPNVADSPEPD
ncbi:helix-turn-helix domain-containing protein [Amycolatopsis japonica]|uniref:helix-turn-helix domain-containing protein n=1 Tax=Amycolatopsis japonica TaxID=208439 RepID=UPI0037BB29D8